jgi:hypothetical protein
LKNQKSKINATIFMEMFFHRKQMKIDKIQKVIAWWGPNQSLVEDRKSPEGGNYCRVEVQVEKRSKCNPHHWYKNSSK